MVSIIAGGKGKGKTKLLLEKANEAIKNSKGTICYLDKSSKHMHELDRRIRLIDVSEYPIRSYNAFIGFICGIISQDYDLEMIFVDSYLKNSFLEDKDITDSIEELNKISEKHNIQIILSVSTDRISLSEVVQDKVILSL